MVYTYLIKSQKDGSYYIGIAEDPYKRLGVHNRGGLASSRMKRPYQLVYVKEHPDYQSARKHEKWLKKKSREYKKERLDDVACPAQNGRDELAPPIQAG